jgi:hypothetical protein
MTFNSLRCAVLVFACAGPMAYVSAQGTADLWFLRQLKPKNFDPPKVFTNSFSIELPKSWQLAPGHTGTIFSVVEPTKKWETGGLIALEYQRLQLALEPSLMKDMSDRELREVQLREGNGKQFGVELLTAGPGFVIFIHYDRPGVSGTDDHVVQYEIPVGLTLYKLICIAPAGGIEKYRPVFAHVAASFTPLKQGS